MSWWTSTAATVSGLVLPVVVLVAWTLSPGLRVAMGAVFPLRSRTGVSGGRHRRTGWPTRCPGRIPSTSATLSRASTTATLPGYSPPPGTRPESDYEQQISIAVEK